MRGLFSALTFRCFQLPHKHHHHDDAPTSLPPTSPPHRVGSLIRTLTTHNRHPPKNTTISNYPKRRRIRMGRPNLRRSRPRSRKPLQKSLPPQIHRWRRLPQSRPGTSPLPPTPRLQSLLHRDDGLWKIDRGGPSGTTYGHV